MPHSWYTGKGLALHPQRNPAIKKGFGMYFKLLTAIVLLVLVLIFIFQNMIPVQIQFLVWQVETARGLMALIILLIGVVIGWLGRGQLAHRRKH